MMEVNVVYNKTPSAAVAQLFCLHLLQTLQLLLRQPQKPYSELPFFRKNLKFRYCNHHLGTYRHYFKNELFEGGGGDVRVQQ